MSLRIYHIFLLLLFLIFGCSKSIDRYALINRHNVSLNKIDTLASLSVGNGEFAFTADITGMQTFYADYENGVSLGTQSQWAWHTTPNDSNYILDEVLVDFESCNGLTAPYAIQHSEGRLAAATNWLRANPHRLHLGIIGLKIVKQNGAQFELSDVQNPKQYLNLWTGLLESEFEVEGEKVLVQTVSHQDNDLVAFKINSELIKDGRLKIFIKFPCGKECHVCPGYNWEKEDAHTSEINAQTPDHTLIHRRLDSTNYFVDINHSPLSQLNRQGKHQFEITPNPTGTEMDFSVSFSPDQVNEQIPFKQAATNSSNRWKDFWLSGGAIDFSDCKDNRAFELERRVVLSQYLTKIQCSGSQPPQETGLTFNSWYGKFHIEMHWWHAAQFALWGRPKLLEQSLNWYFDIVEFYLLILKVFQVHSHKQDYLLLYALGHV